MMFKKLYIYVKKICISTSKQYHFINTLKQRQNVMLKEQWLWVDTKTNFVLMLYQHTQHVESTSAVQYQQISTSFRRTLLMLFRVANDRHDFDVLFRYSFAGWKIDATSTCFF